MPLPGIGGEPGITTTPLLPDYIKYIFNFSIAIGGLIAFGFLVYGGLRFLTSAGDPSKMSDAKDQIFSALLGLIVLLGSWIILTTINPELIRINPLKPPSGLTAGALPGVYLCKTEFSPPSSTDCQLFTGSMPDLGRLNDNVGFIRFSNPTDVDARYGAVLHENSTYQGTCQIYTTEGVVGGGVAGRELPNGKPSAITVFEQGSAVGLGATAFDDKEYTGGYYDFAIGEYPSMRSYNYIDCGEEECGWLEQSISSVKIKNGYMAVLFGDANYGGTCSVFFRDISALGPTTIGNDQVSSIRVLSGIGR